MARHRFLCPLRWADVDVYGVINNVAIVRYLEEARVDLLGRMPPSERDSFLRRGSVVVRHEIDYKHTLLHRRDPVEIETWISNVRASTVTISYLVKDSDRLYASARTVLAPFDYKAKRPRRLTEAESAFFTQYLEVQ
ncbi:MAG TPA: thioesterase family protein [Streptosporangiaceae bacterium]|jgi:acyl-CoA thioester hydrolase|nr:thioesterase family protein [Streptosporangiaceae bacterium]